MLYLALTQTTTPPAGGCATSCRNPATTRTLAEPVVPARGNRAGLTRLAGVVGPVQQWSRRRSFNPAGAVDRRGGAFSKCRETRRKRVTTPTSLARYRRGPLGSFGQMPKRHWRRATTTWRCSPPCGPSRRCGRTGHCCWCVRPPPTISCGTATSSPPTTRRCTIAAADADAIRRAPGRSDIGGGAGRLDVELRRSETDRIRRR